MRDAVKVFREVKRMREQALERHIYNIITGVHPEAVQAMVSRDQRPGAPATKKMRAACKIYRHMGKESQKELQDRASLCQEMSLEASIVEGQGRLSVRLHVNPIYGIFSHRIQADKLGNSPKSHSL